MSDLIFITGTDTGVGKTVLTALLLAHFRANNIRALAMKPFCSGGRGDVQLLQKLQSGELTDSEMNPFYFPKPVAPYVALEKHGATINPKTVLESIRKIQSRCDLLLIEGAGGVMVPLAKSFLIRDLILKLRSKVILVGKNKLGTLNHCMLSHAALRGLKSKVTVVLMDPARRDASYPSNARVLREMVAPTEVFSLPFLGKSVLRARTIEEHQKKIKKTLAAIVGSV